jgi:hypothetical protein
MAMVITDPLRDDTVAEPGIMSSVPGTCGREFASGTLVRVLENWDTVGLYADVPSGHATKPSSGALAELLLAELNDP